MLDQVKDFTLITRRQERGFLGVADIATSPLLEVKSDVVTISGYISQDFCREVIDFAKRLGGWGKSVTYDEPSDPRKSARQSSQILLGGTGSLDAQIHRVFDSAFALYQSVYDGAKVDVSCDEGYSLLRYEVGGQYEAHCDRGSGNNRVVSGVIYLNDDFEGGELHFPRYGLTIAPQAGAVVMFPSIHTHVHASLPVKSGTKYAIVTWFK